MAIGLKWNPEGNALTVALKGFFSQYSDSICKTVDFGVGVALWDIVVNNCFSFGGLQITLDSLVF